MVIGFGMLLSPPWGRASASDFKDAAAPRFAHSDVVFDLFMETLFFSFNRSLIQFFKTFFAFLGITGPNRI